MDKSRLNKISLNSLSMLGLGERIRKIRQKRKKTLQRLADEIAVSRSLLSQIERGKANPSINTLWNLADALEIHVAALFRSENEKKLMIESAEIKDISKGAKCYLISSRVFTDLEIAYVEYSPGGSSGERSAQHSGVEYLLVLEGQIQITIGNRTFLLKKNVGVHFSGKIPHNVKNIGRKKARVLVVITPSE